MAIREATEPQQPPAAVVAPEIEQTTLGTRRGRIILTGFTTAHFSHHVSNSLLGNLLQIIHLELIEAHNCVQTFNQLGLKVMLEMHSQFGLFGWSGAVDRLSFCCWCESRTSLFFMRLKI